MKELKRISLSALSAKELSARQQSALKGGCFWCWCSCGCKYAGEQEGSDDSYYGGSSTASNDSANDSNKDAGSWY